jgi:hypothetical protein
MDACYRFPDVTKRKCSQEITYRVEMARMDMSTYAIDWSTPTAANFSPFTDIPEIEYDTDPEAGAIGSGDGTFKCLNLEFATNATMEVALLGNHPNDYQWVIRISRKSGATYPILYEGIIQHRDIDMEIVKRREADTWKFTFSTKDMSSLLDNIIATTFLSALSHTYDYDPIGAGKKIWICDTQQTPYVSYELVDTGYFDGAGWSDVVPSKNRYIKLYDVLQALSDAMGITAAVVVNHTWEFYYEKAGSEIAVNWNVLYVMRGFLLSVGVWGNQYGFFDNEKKSASSWFNCSTCMELLKRILVPFGLRAKVKYDASGVPYLKVTELITSLNTYTVNASTKHLYKSSRYKPADRVLNGFIANVDNVGKYVHGGDGDSTASITCCYQSAQSMVDTRWSFNAGVTTQYDAELCSLYCIEAATGDIHSIHKITVFNYGQGAAKDLGTNTVTSEATDADNRMVVAKAACAYYFNPATQTTDKVGIYRPQMRRLEITSNRIEHEYAEGDLLSWTMGSYSAIEFYIKSISFDLKEQKTKIVAETGAFV